MTQVRIKHRRTAMYVARNDKTNRYGFGAGVISSGWKWVRNADDASLFDKMTAIHPVIQLDLEGKVDFIDTGGAIYSQERDIPKRESAQ